MADYTDPNAVLNIKRLSENDSYYSNVYKKTEKLVSTVFYILSFVSDTETNKLHKDHVTRAAFTTHEVSLELLRVYESEAPGHLFRLQHALAALASALTMATAAGVTTEAVRELLCGEIDLIQRRVRHEFGGGPGGVPSFLTRTEAPASAAPSKSRSGSTRSQAAGSNRDSTQAQAPRSSRTHIPAGDISSDAHLVYSQLTDRATRIKTVLEAKPEATIKDISEVITDISEKTIQRELNSLIEKGQVIRQGERRWSRYSLAP